MILLDLNVLLDVIQKREPYYRASAAVLETVIHGHVTGVLALSRWIIYQRLQFQSDNIFRYETFDHQVIGYLDGDAS